MRMAAAVTVALCAAAFATARADGAPGGGGPGGPGGPGDAVGPFLERHCVACHGPEVRKGGLRLDGPTGDFSDAAVRERWKRVRDRIADGSMPPPRKARPAAADVSAVVGWVDAGLVAAERAARAAEGRVGLRRLNRTEYENTLRDLLGVRVDVREMLPPDAVVHGFDNMAEALSLSPTQLGRYLEAAELALSAAVSAGPRPETLKRTYSLADCRCAVQIGRTWVRRPDGAVVIFRSKDVSAQFLDAFRAPHPGRYRVLLTGYAHQSKAAVVFALYGGRFRFNGDGRLQGYHEFAPGGAGGAGGAGASTVVETTADLDDGESLQVAPHDLGGVGVFPINNAEALASYAGPGLALLGVEVEGPLFEEWPTRGHRLLFGDLPAKPRNAGDGGKAPETAPTWEVVSADPEADARRLLPGFLGRAFRRPATEADAAPYLRLFAAERRAGATFREAMLAAAAAALCSPEFLYLRGKPGRLDDFALASRLSYFLRRSMPDDELFRAAAEGRLSRPEVLRGQAERLLRGRDAARLTADFTDAWLNLRDIDATTPDRQLYPEYDGLLRDSMVRETRAFFDEVLGGNLPAATFLHSDFAMLNGRLARHYGIAGVSGVAVRRVPLPGGSLRGGLLAQASVLKVSANGTNTSPVVRGVYVLERFLGVVPPPPPPGVPAVEPDIRGAKTVRELLDKHRTGETCTGCHRLIDPPGFALEGFDVIGRRRERFRALVTGGGRTRRIDGPPVDAAGVLADGRRFDDFPAFRSLMAAEPERFARCLAEKLVAFATGREAGPADRPEIDRILEATRADGYRVGDLVHAVIQSDLFRNK